MLRFTEISLGEPARRLCKRCKAQPAPQSRHVAEVCAQVATAAAEHCGTAGCNIALTGFEPLAYPELAQVLRTAVDAGVSRIRLDSDATLLDSAQAAQQLIALGVRHVQCDLFGASGDTHDALSVTPGGFERTLAGVRTFIDAAEELGVRFQVSARVPVCRHNLKELPQIVTAAAENRISYVRLVVEDETLDLWAAAPWIEAACDTGIVYTTWVEVENMPFGPAAGWELHLASLYRPVAGAKSALCATCPLDDVCSGAHENAATSVTGRFQPPEDAARIANEIERATAPDLEPDS